MAEILCGPLLRFVSDTEATVWVETDAACSVEVLDHTTRTFHVEGHHYALVEIGGLQPGATLPYEVHLDGERRWPDPATGAPASVIRTLAHERPVQLAFASCRVSLPHEPPFTLTKDEDDRGRGLDALYALDLRLRDLPHERWPDAFLFLGDQVYADEVPVNTAEYIRSKRDTSRAPGAEVGSFEEYTQLYHDNWGDPAVRWLLSTLSSAMIFDDHDVHDDWNTSAEWRDAMRAQSWWSERIVGGLMSYWVYQHIGNLSPAEHRRDGLLDRLREAEDAGPVLRAFAAEADRNAEGARWSFYRDFGATRLLMIDSRAGRVLEPGRRDMLDPDEWRWVEEHAEADVDHLLIGTSLPWLLAPGLHELEAWNEAVCGGAWGARAARYGEKVRQALDLEHWAAFRTSFRRLSRLVEEKGSGRRGRVPHTIVALSGDVHHAYVAEVAFRRSAGVRSGVYQVVCSPIRNPLDQNERRALSFADSRAGEWLARLLSRAAGVRRPDVRWRLTGDTTFDNQIATLDIDGAEALLRVETAVAGGSGPPRLRPGDERRLSAS